MYSQEMELSSCNIKEILIFSQKKAFLLFQKMENLGKFLIFSQKKVVLIFRKTETLKNYISGNQTFLYFRRNLKNQNLLNFSKKRFEYILLKKLLDNSFHLFYKLYQTILLVHIKTLKAFFCVESFLNFFPIPNKLLFFIF